MTTDKKKARSVFANPDETDEEYQARIQALHEDALVTAYEERQRKADKEGPRYGVPTRSGPRYRRPQGGPTEQPAD